MSKSKKTLSLLTSQVTSETLLEKIPEVKKVKSNTTDKSNKSKETKETKETETKETEKNLTGFYPKSKETEKTFRIPNKNFGTINDYLVSKNVDSTFIAKLRERQKVSEKNSDGTINKSFIPADKFIKTIVVPPKYLKLSPTDKSLMTETRRFKIIFQDEVSDDKIIRVCYYSKKTDKSKETNETNETKETKKTETKETNETKETKKTKKSKKSTKVAK